MKLNNEQMRVLTEKIFNEYVSEFYDPNIQKELDFISEVYDKSEYKRVLGLFGYDPSVDKIVSVINPDFHKNYCNRVWYDTKGIYSFKSNPISLKFTNNHCDITKKIRDILVISTINSKIEISDLIADVISQLKNSK